MDYDVFFRIVEGVLTLSTIAFGYGYVKTSKVERALTDAIYRWALANHVDSDVVSGLLETIAREIDACSASRRQSVIAALKSAGERIGVRGDAQLLGSKRWDATANVAVAQFFGSERWGATVDAAVARTPSKRAAAALDTRLDS